MSTKTDKVLRAHLLSFLDYLDRRQLCFYSAFPLKSSLSESMVSLQNEMKSRKIKLLDFLSSY